MKKVYYQLEMYQKSPLRVGSGDGEITDSDLMLDGRGCPFIPGSSVAGVLRDLYTKMHSSSWRTDTLFGYVGGELLEDSHVAVSDAAGPETATSADYLITVRDGIRLDEWGIVISGSKYDFQTVETSLPYYCILEWTGDNGNWELEIEEGLDPLMKMISAEGIAFGARTTRGYGRMSVTVRKKTFTFPEDRESWLDFDPFRKDAFQDECCLQGEKPEKTAVRIHLDLRIKGSFSVKVNTARAEMLPDGSVPDSIPLSNAEGKPVIPGTSWAGVFRHHMLSVIKQAGLADQDESRSTELNRLFGMTEKEGDHIRSGIYFTETAIEGGAPYSLTRNAVDRFTQAPRNMALFTSRLWQGGKGELEIAVEKDRLDPIQAQILAITLIDLDLGLLTFGGAAGTGHGRCEIERILVNGEEVTERLRKQDCHFLEETL